MSTAASTEPIRYAPQVSRLIPGTASTGSTRKQNHSIGAIAAAKPVFPRRETALPDQLRELLLPSPMRTAGEGWALFWAVVSDYLAILVSWAAVWTLTEIATQPKLSWTNRRVSSPMLLPSEHFGLGVIFAVITTLLAYSEGGYRTAQRNQRQTLALLKSVAWSSLTVWGIAGGMGSLRGSTVFASSAFFSVLSLLVMRRIRSKRTGAAQSNARNVLIVGAGTTGRAIAAFLSEHPEMGRSFRGFLDRSGVPGFGVLGRPEDLGRIARAEFVDEVILAVSDRRELGHLAIREALRNRLDVKIVPDLLGSEAEDSFVERWGEIPLLTLRYEQPPVTRLLLRRSLDVVISGCALVATAPIMMAVAALIRLDSRGPALYTALRVGRKGRRFRCLKFRTMTTGADQQRESLREKNQRDGPCFKMVDDPRVTRVGRWLRRYSLDELPQLWNVFRGEMSLVGPRPHPLDDVARYELNHLRRLDVTPGLTGLWQISARQSRSFQTNLALDLEYIQSWSLWMDLRILFKTLSVVAQGTGV